LENIEEEEIMIHETKGSKEAEKCKCSAATTYILLHLICYFLAKLLLLSLGVLYIGHMVLGYNSYRASWSMRAAATMDVQFKPCMSLVSLSLTSVFLISVFNWSLSLSLSVYLGFVGKISVDVQV
jgi:hypothetical protein